MKPTDMQAAKKRLEQKKFAASVLSAFDNLKHNSDLKARELRAEVERKARNKQ